MAVLIMPFMRRWAKSHILKLDVFQVRSRRMFIVAGLNDIKVRVSLNQNYDMKKETFPTYFFRNTR